MQQVRLSLVLKAVCLDHQFSMHCYGFKIEPLLVEPFSRQKINCGVHFGLGEQRPVIFTTCICMHTNTFRNAYVITCGLDNELINKINLQVHESDTVYIVEPSTLPSPQPPSNYLPWEVEHMHVGTWMVALVMDNIVLYIMVHALRSSNNYFSVVLLYILCNQATFGCQSCWLDLTLCLPVGMIRGTLHGTVHIKHNSATPKMKTLEG